VVNVGSANKLHLILGLRLSDIRSGEVRRIGESRAALAAGVGTVMLVLATLFWAKYLIFGPIRDSVVEVMSVGGD
jgi:hypothetical protein